MSDSSDQEKDAFQILASKNLKFLVNEFGMKQSNAYVSGGSDPRDKGLVIRFSRPDLFIDLAWKENEHSLIVNIYFIRDDLSRRERHVYFEPFLEYLSDGRERAIVPYIEYGMSMRQIDTVMKERKSLFIHGFAAVLSALSSKLRTNLQRIEHVSSDKLKEYQSRKK